MEQHQTRGLRVRLPVMALLCSDHR